MRQRKWNSVSEINLTPLLDVLFTILFIIMMTGAQHEKGMEDEHQQQLLRKEQEISNLKEQVVSRENQMASYEKYQAEAVILTVDNINRDGHHYLVMRQGLEQTMMENILLGVDKTENTKMRINAMITNLVEGIDNQPVYVVFYCDKKNIYTTEYRAIEEVFTELQGRYKEVFFKVMEGEK